MRGEGKEEGLGEVCVCGGGVGFITTNSAEFISRGERTPGEALPTHFILGLAALGNWAIKIKQQYCTQFTEGKPRHRALTTCLPDLISKEGFDKIQGFSFPFSATNSR